MIAVERLAALGISYVLVGSMPPADFFALIDDMGLDISFLGDCFDAAEKLEAAGDKAVLAYLDAYGRFLSGDTSALTVRY